MRNKFLLTLVSLFLAAGAFAQPATPNPNQNQNQQNQPDPQEAMQQMRQQIFQNMQAKGIDPQEFFGQIRQQMQDGTFDPAKFQQMMIDRGIIDKQMADKMQATMQSAALGRIRDQIEATDEEWAVIAPKVQKVLACQADVAGPAQRGGFSMIMSMPVTSTGMAKATTDLRAAVADPHTSDQTFALRLQAWREAHEKAQANLATAQKDLVEVLTTRQEAELMQMGLIP
jgi:hypothetical protein